MANQAILRIGREISQLQQGTDLSLAVACQEEDIRNVKALIIGPAGTPYEFGFFEFSIKFPKDYPASPPKVESVTTNGGRCRFNPNIYACGKVCLTWRGESGEQWSSAQGLESILISIQSLMSANPYENEPGYEDAKGENDLKSIPKYIEKIYHETIRISVIQRLEDALGIQADGSLVLPPGNSPGDLDEDADENPPFEPFHDLCKRRVLWYYESYLNIIKEQESKNAVGTRFERMPFEGGGNTMDGRFNYPDLKARLGVIKDAIMQETENWETEGLKAKANDTRISVSLQRQYEQIIEDLKERNNITLDIAFENDNPFVWKLTFFGRPMTNLDGGIFNIKVSLSPNFPDEQPRIFVQTPLFHHRVSKDGVLCYFCRRPEDMRSHVEAIVEALEDEAPRYDPRATVNPEASELFWGSPEQKKQYNRLLRRAAQRSTE
ncbi:conserved hypothetical protein [Uncinocarpus reesii 1704]|uniref:Ubiquitin-conjugating enzyme E2 Z n=1 Tax=Uncinocarpus reesii (strain UAMH 1704) TaxID=336963 RepID=C4JHW4_UNCRE|nr:uncharacterized protein UREG_01389 [Uncinocarpus reesii 1704]EEP76540.1 conserved hypothetical protein [Uncinocarpus reesii 1704]